MYSAWPYSRPAYPFPEPDSLGRRVGLMAVVNLTPDSFYDGGRYLDGDAALQRCQRCIEEGADIIDIGAESTRPGSKPVEPAIQIDRLRPLILRLRDIDGIIISVDTSDAEVMQACLDAGAHMVNDVCALEREGALEVVGRRDCLVCLMHKQGIPETMQRDPHYDDVTARVRRYLYARVAACLESGIPLERLAIDPGFGFGKSLEHNCTLLARLAELRFAGLPLIAGLSRKTMIGQTLPEPDRQSPELRLEGSLIAAARAVANGASIVRVHDVAATRRALMASLTLDRFVPA